MPETTNIFFQALELVLAGAAFLVTVAVLRALFGPRRDEEETR